MAQGKVKIWQMSSLLRIIYKNPGITRIQLSKKLNIDRAMITHLINHLIALGWLEKHQEGAKKVPLVFNKECIYTAGLDLQPEYQHFVVCNIEGEVVYHQEWQYDSIGVESFIQTELPAAIECSGYAVSAVGLAIPGVCSTAKNIVQQSRPFSITQPVALPSYVAGTEIPLYIENDARCSAYGLVAFKKESDNFFLLYSNFVPDPHDERRYKRIGRSAALFFNGTFYRGSHNCAGEIPSLFRVDRYRSKELYIPYEKRLQARSNPPLKARVLEELIILASYVASILDVKKMYIGGTLELEESIRTDNFLTYLREYQLYPDVQDTEVLFAGVDEFSTAVGASGFAFENVFSEPALESPSSFCMELMKSY